MFQTITRGRKEMLYLTMHSTHLWLYGAGHVIKDHSAREETHCSHYMGYSFTLAARVLLYTPDSIAHTTAFLTPVMEHWLEQEIVQWVQHDRSI